MKIRVNTSPDKRLVSFIVITVVALLLNNVTHNLPISEALDSFINLGLKIVVGVAFIVQISIVFNRLDKHLAVFIVAALFVIIMNLLLFPELTKYFMRNLSVFFAFCFPVYLVIYSINDFDLLRKELTKASYFIATIMFLFSILVFAGLVDFTRYDMSLGYHCLFPTLILLWDYVQNRKIITLISILVLFTSILLFGSRGPLLSLTLFGTFFFVRFLIHNNKYWQVVFVMILIFTFLLLYKQIVVALGDLVSSFGLYSRTLTMLSSSDTVNMTGREEIYDTLISIIQNDPLTIRGINAEWSLFGIYAHNIILELLYQLGFILGGIALIYIFWRAFQTLLFNKLDSKRIFCIVLIFSSLPPLFFSGSFWASQMFWMWMAVYSKIAILDKYKDELTT